MLLWENNAMTEMHWIKTHIFLWKKLHLKNNNIIQETYRNVVDYMDACYCVRNREVREHGPLFLRSESM
jgi:hypothetical protein